MLHWQGGDHTEVAVHKNKTGEHRWKTNVGTEELITALARQLPDLSIASLLNRIGVRSAKGLTWNEPRVRSFRSDRDIPIYREGERAERGEVTLAEAATLLGTSKMTMLRLIEQGVVPAKQISPRAPWVILRNDLECPRVQQVVKHGVGSPQPVDLKQGSLKLQ
jgi:excisionase family DNA binding protein